MPPLTNAKCAALARPGRHGDGGGLYLHVKPSGAKSWCQRMTIRGRRRELGLGSFPLVSLDHARTLAARNRATAARGGDPLAERRRAEAPTFRAAAARVFELHRPRWRSARHPADWWATLERHAFPTLGDVTVDAISRVDILNVLTPIWTRKPETARRLRQRIRTVMQWAVAYGYAQRNPAGELIDGALPPMPKVKAHLRALPYAEVPPALAAIDRSRASLAARCCLRFLILTAARSGTARGALWRDVDRERREWRVPGATMKSGAPHRVPLSAPALAALDAVEPLRDESGLVFPSPARRAQPMAAATLTAVLRHAGLAHRTTVHGFRSAFRDWAAEQTDAAHPVMELALSHSVGSAVERAYARSDLFDKRRVLMDQWAGFVTGLPARPAAPLPVPVQRVDGRAADPTILHIGHEPSGIARWAD